MTTWHEVHRDGLSVWDRASDWVASQMGSWRFLFIMTGVIVVWIASNITAVFGLHFDPYPFILLNLLFSTQASYSAPLILMAANRASDRDRVQAQHDYDVNVAAKNGVDEVKAMQVEIHNLVSELHRMLKEYGGA